MALYAIGDLHLSLGADKPMEIFGEQWENHPDKLRLGFAGLSDDDITVLCGDTSWGMDIEDAREDFAFIDSLPGRKIILKGNHDYWWTTASKMNGFLKRNGFGTICFLHNNCYEYSEGGKEFAICGTKGSFFEEETGNEHDRLILNREAGRLKTSLEKAGTREKIVFLHYPPIYLNYRCGDILTLLKEYEVRYCYYGHIHGKGHASAFNGWAGGTQFKLVSTDYLGFKPEKIILY